MRHWLWLGTGALALLLGWQTWTIVGLRGDISDLREQVSRLAGDEARQGGGSNGSASGGSGSAPVSARDNTGSRVAERPKGHRSSSFAPTGVRPEKAATDPAALDEAVERTLDRVEGARFAKKREQWIQKATDRVEGVVGELIVEGQVNEAMREEVTDLLRNQLYETWQLKDDVRTGDVSEADAITRYESASAGVRSALNDLVGEETAADLLERMAGK